MSTEASVQSPSKLFCFINDIKGLNWTTLTEEDVPQQDMRGKWVIITGANNGIGLETAKTLARWGANLILGCREPPKWETSPDVAVEKCLDLAKSAGHSSIIEWWPINMTDMDSIDAFAQRWLDAGRALDILFNNAGMAPHSADEQLATKDGFQIVHQVNLLSHVLLTYRLLDSLAQSEQPRIVCSVSSKLFEGHFDPENMNHCEELPVHARGHLYANNKLYLQTWIGEIQRRFLLHEKYRHITINGTHPGFANSGIWNFSEKNSVTTYAGALKKSINQFLVRNIGISIEQASFSLINLGTNPKFGPNPDLQEVGEQGATGGGNYFNRIWKEIQSPYCEDPASRLQVWNKVNEELLSVRKNLHTLDELNSKS
ncbi:hypothetical protein N7488_011643 [Penicillium malachiteum]|nr:hypothetical protein N7488_011643 [Penicillium malachiteum]